MDNEFRILIRGKSKKTITQVAEDAGLSRNTLTSLLHPDGWPRSVKLSTLDKLAAALGYRVKVELEKVNNES